jgi:pilus assembly protein CpaE
MKRIVLAGSPDHFAGRVQQALRGEAADRLYRWVEQLDGPTAVDALLTLDPAVVILGPGLPTRLALWLAAEFDRTRSSVAVVIALPADEGLVEQALAAGVRAVVRPEAEPQQILAAVTRALEAVERRSSVPGPAAGPRAGSARVITVAAPKGGAGKTMIAANLAVGLAAVEPRAVTIVDLDLQFGDIAFALGVNPRHTVQDAVSTSQPLDLTTLKVFLAHHPAELYALCAPDDPARGEMIQATSVEEIISLLVSGFEYVVVDTGAGLGEHTLAAIEVSTDLVFVADMDVPSIKHLAKVVHVLDRLGMNESRRHVVLNRADARAGLSLGDVAEASGLHVDVEIPSSRHVPVALNTGSPILISNPKSPVSKALWKVIGRFADSAEQRSQSRRSMRWSA